MARMTSGQEAAVSTTWHALPARDVPLNKGKVAEVRSCLNVSTWYHEWQERSSFGDGVMRQPQGSGAMPKKGRFMHNRISYRHFLDFYHELQSSKLNGFAER
jgi:hypothetical protein